MDIVTATTEPVDGRHYVHRYISLITDVGGYVCRIILLSEILKIGECVSRQSWGVAEFLNAYKTQIEDYYNGQNDRPKLLKKEQMDYLFPKGRASTSAEKFDVTLIIFLLRAFVFCDVRFNAMWGRPLIEIYDKNTSVIADVARIKCYRNKLHDICDTKTSLSEKEFWELWAKLTRIFLHLGDQYHISDIYQMIDKVLHEPLDEQREKELDRAIKNIHDDLKRITDHEKEFLDFMQAIDEDQTEIKKGFGEIKTLLVAKEPVDDVLADEYFVKTEQYEEALKTLQNHRIIILHGAPGEGKTTLATKLVKAVSKVNPFPMRSWADWKSIASNVSNVDAILIDDMFGAQVFDKVESRNWQKYLPDILTWVNNSQDTDRYIVITSRTYILQNAREQLYLGKLFHEQNVLTLSSNKLKEAEKQSILEMHFATAKKRLGQKHFTTSNKTEEQKQEHVKLLECISKLVPASQGPSFTIGFPECARLFANSKDLYEMGTVFFRKPMKHVIKCISEISKHDDVFIAFFVLWAQKDETLTSTDLERSVSETPDCIKIPILKLQYNPENHVRTVREELAIHAHSEGFITSVSENSYRFSHNVVRDAVGLNAYHRNATAVLELCDKAFIENYIRILKPPRDIEAEEVSRNLILPLPQFRYNQLSLRIGELSIPEKQEAIDTLKSEGYQDIDKSTKNVQKYTIFKHPIFKNEEFCTAFIQYHRDRSSLEVLLKTKLTTVASELSRYKAFLDTEVINTAIRLPSFLLWQTESLSVFAKLLFTEMIKYPAILDTEISMAMLIGSMFVSRETVEFLSTLGGKVTHQMILLAYETSKTSEIDEPKKQEFIQLLESQIAVVEPNCSLKIHAAAFEGCLDIVEEISKKDPEQAKTKYTASDGNDLMKASLYHIAAYKQNSELIATLVRCEVEPNVFDAKRRSPFLYAISKGKYTVVEDLYEIAKKHGYDMTPDDSNSTPLHMTIKKSVKEKDAASKKTFRDLSMELSKSCSSEIHTKNSKGLTPLQVACEYNATEVVEEMMIRQKIHLAEEEKSLMHDFVMSGNKKAIELLLKCGFDHNITDSDERTPLMLAEKLGNIEIAAFIKDLIKTQNVISSPSEP